MSTRARVAAFVTVALVVVAGAAAYLLQQREDSEQQLAREPEAPQTAAAALADGPRIVFRHTGVDSEYGVVAMVPLDDPGGPRAFTGQACDRVAAWDGGASCLVTERGVVTKFVAQELDGDWQVVGSRPLPGNPSRTRVSDDGRLVATTSFVTGHSYISSGFSTATEVHETGDGRDWGNLEDFDLVVDGERTRPADRNVWGVTFVDDRTFYATVASGGRTWLVEGDLEERTLTTVAPDAECPAVSPDRSRVAFKVDVDPGRPTVWQLAVLDLTTGTRTLLEGSDRGLDDQAEWLDDDPRLYGLARADEPGVTDVWAVDAERDARPRLLIEQAWSPTVVR